jgi:hypothetical protein
VFAPVTPSPTIATPASCLQAKNERKKPNMGFAARQNAKKRASKTHKNMLMQDVRGHLVKLAQQGVEVRA